MTITQQQTLLVGSTRPLENLIYAERAESWGDRLPCHLRFAHWTTRWTLYSLLGLVNEAELVLALEHTPPPRTTDELMQCMDDGCWEGSLSDTIRIGPWGGRWMSYLQANLITLEEAQQVLRERPDDCGRLGN